MKRTIIKNLIIVLMLIILTIPYNYFVNYFAAQLSIYQYVAVIIYALLCGSSLILMDLSNKRINIGFALFFLIYSAVNIEYQSFFVYGPTIFLYILMVGALFTSAIKSGD